MIIRKLRLQRSWSQEQLAEFSGLSVRTIQRIERGQKPGLESLKSLAAVFEVQITELQDEAETMNSQTSDTTLRQDEQDAIKYVKDIKGFYSHLTTYALIITALFILNLIVTPGYMWVFWTAAGWGIGIVAHALSVFEVFNLFGPNWEKSQIEKRLGRKL